MSTTVRISSELHELLKNLAEQSSTSMQEVLREALERYRRDIFLDGLDRDLAAAGDYTEEIVSLDGTLNDGLENW